MRDYFLKLFKYNHWANELVINKFLETSAGDTEILKLISHVLNAQYIWLSRVTGAKEYDAPVWRVLTIEDLQNFSNKGSELWENYVENISMEGFSDEVSYTNSQGKSFATSVSDILAHVINHGTYHRAQIAKLLRLKNIDPPNTDYIIFVRTG